MKTGILICGMNGAGKSTLGKALAEKLQFHFIDNEDLYFPKTDPNYLYAAPRRRAEVEKLLLREIQLHGNFVFTSVTGDYSEEIQALFQHIVLIQVPRTLRLARVENRSFQRFGNRMLPGGDLCEQEQWFLDFVRSRPENTAEEWAQAQNRPLIRVDGTKPVEESADFVASQIQLF